MVAPRPAVPKCPSCARDMARTFGDRGWIGWACLKCPSVSIVESR